MLTTEVASRDPPFCIFAHATACLSVKRTHRQNLKSCCFPFLSRRDAFLVLYPPFSGHALLLRRWPLNNSKKSLNQRHRECGRSCWPPTLPRYQGPHIQQRLHSVGGRLYPLPLFFWPAKSLVRTAKDFSIPTLGSWFPCCWRVRTTLASICPGLSPTNGAWFLIFSIVGDINMYLCMLIQYTDTTIIINRSHIITSISNGDSIITTIEND